MSEYIVEIPEEPAKVVHDGWNVRIEWQYKMREEIVRCRDCRHYEPNTYSHFTCELLQFHVEPYGFCAWGERREIE